MGFLGWVWWGRSRSQVVKTNQKASITRVIFLSLSAIEEPEAEQPEREVELTPPPVFADCSHYNASPLTARSTGGEVTFERSNF